MASSPGAFPTTRWTLIDRVRDGDPSSKEAALEELCQAYWLPLYAFARRSGLDPHGAEDAVQEFFLSALKEDLLLRADEQIGKLRNLLGIAFKRHLGHLKRHDQAVRRGGGAQHIPWLPIDAEERYRSLSADSASPDELFHQQWARNLIERAQQALRESYEEDGKRTLFNSLCAFLPWNGQEEEAMETSAAEKVGMSAVAFRSARHRMRKRLRDCIRKEVQDTIQTTDPVIIEAEIRELLQVLAP